MTEMSPMTQRLAAALIVLILGIGACYFVYSQKVKVAETRLKSAVDAKTLAQTELDGKKAELEKVKNQPEATKEPTAKYLSVKVAIPQNPMLAESRLQLRGVARRAGITLEEANFQTSSGGGDPSAAGSGPVPMSLEISGVGRYSNFLMFMQLLHEEVEEINGTLYVHGRLYNVTGWEFGSAGGEGAGPDMGATADGDSSASSALADPKDPQAKNFSVTVLVYADASGDATTGEPTGTEPGAAGAGGATGAATGGAGTGAPADPNATGGAPGAGGAPTGGTAGATTGAPATTAAGAGTGATGSGGQG